VGPSLTEEGVRFVNLTRINAHFGLARISARRAWRPTGGTNHHLGDNDDFKSFLGKLNGQLQRAKWAPDATVKVAHVGDAPDRTPINTRDYKLGDLHKVARVLNHWVRYTKDFEPWPDILVDPGTKAGQKLLKVLRGKPFRKRFSGAKLRVSAYESWDAGPECGPDYGKKREVREVELKADTEFPPQTLFELRPITAPLTLEPGDQIQLPGLGHPANMEWWHFQYEEGYEGMNWGELLGQVGWTRQGLLHARDSKLYGNGGIGYRTWHLSKAVR
jgi:hypothetical protein